MSDRKQHDAETVYPPHLVPEKVMAPIVGLSVAFLQKDRRTAQRIPFVRLGDRCLYHVPSVIEALSAYAVGGPQGRRGVSRKQAAA